MAAKTDMDRLGVFSELGYITIGDKYVPPNSKPFSESAGKGKQMLIGSTKAKSALQSGYFSKTFDRIMQGEAHDDIVRIRRRNRLEESKKNLAKAWIPSNGNKLPSGLGSSYGCLNGHAKAFSAATRPKDQYKPPGRNFYTMPGKLGTGYGYLKVTIGPHTRYSSEPYDLSKDLRKKEQKQEKSLRKGGPFKLNSHAKDYFEENPYKSKKSLPPRKASAGSKEKPKPFIPSAPAKSIGGCKAGTFDPYPTHSSDPYITDKKPTPGKLVGGIFKPSPGTKSMPSRSTMAQTIRRTMNRSNFLTVMQAST